MLMYLFLAICYIQNLLPFLGFTSIHSQLLLIGMLSIISLISSCLPSFCVALLFSQMLFRRFLRTRRNRTTIFALAAKFLATTFLLNTRSTTCRLAATSAFSWLSSLASALLRTLSSESSSKSLRDGK